MNFIQAKVNFQVPVAMHSMVPKIEQRLAVIEESTGATVNVHSDKIGFSQSAGATNIPFTGTVSGTKHAVENALAGINGILNGGKY